MWAAVALQSFGGPAGQIAVMQRVLVEERRWIGQQRFLHALSYCLLLPGPEAQQLATYVGWLLNGTRGALLAGTLFVLPGVAAMLVLSALYVGLGETAVVSAVFTGVGPAVVVVVAQALWRVARRSLRGWFTIAVAAAAFVALVLVGAPFPLVVLLAGAVGWLAHRVAPATVTPPEPVETASGAAPPPAPLLPDDALHREPAGGLRRVVRVLGVGLLLWTTPVAAVALIAGSDSVLLTQGIFFAGTAVVSFGGAYAVLAFVAQRAVETYGWLSGPEMVRGLALAESTPGPLIMVVQFVAFLGAYRDPGTTDPWLNGVLGALLTTWVTFVPCFVFILLGAPVVERLRGSRPVAAVLGGISAAVVGVIGSLALYFAEHTLFARTLRWDWGPFHAALPDVASLRWPALGLLVVLAVLAVRWRWSVLRLLGAGALLGLATLV